ncbi:hypothetical protein MLD38_008915 [Melastoma candidum]|uniref:Uncharacterized protein n=1 Tax=Melastoma candidum TaxID=119954 RepID=A0ACB9RW23_9MYRT|nr:hypothetical protein MLD38_008915 [Melastoma candidum]
MVPGNKIAAAMPAPQHDEDKRAVAKCTMYCAHQCAVLCLFFFGLLYAFTKWIPSVNYPRDHPSDKSGWVDGYTDVLGRALADASTINRTLIITMVNRAYVEGDKPMLDLFLDSFWLGEGTRPLTNNLLIVAVDATSFDRCRFLRLHCYWLEPMTGNFEGEKLYMTRDFIELMWRRTRFLLDVLRRGYNFIFTDTDVMWLRDPLAELIPDESMDLQISVDHFNGNQWSTRNPVNTGFYMIRSNNRTISLLREWYDRRKSSGRAKEQDVLQQMVREGVLWRLGLKVRFLDTVRFSGFCNDSKDISRVATVHANCCRSIDAKLADLMVVIHDWRKFTIKSASGRGGAQEGFRWSKHEACWKSWH